LDVFSQVCTPLNSIRLTVKKAMGLAYASGDYTMKEISEWFCVHYSTVSRAVKLFEVNA
jgi:DNA-binding MarR family transcriptional regulator